MAKDILKSTALVSAFSLAGKVLGLLKNLYIAAVFGASITLDAFWVAYLLPFAIPSILKGIAASAFIPRFMASLQVEHPDWRGANTFFTAMLMMTVLFAAIFYLFANYVVSLTAPSLNPDAVGLASELLGYFALTMIVLGGSAVLTSLCFALERFSIPACESFITNTVIILMIFLLVDSFGIYGVVVGVVAGLFLQFLCLIWVTRDHLRAHVRLAFDWSHPDFRLSLAHVLPLLLGYLGATTMSVVDQAFASSLEDGSISILAYATMLALLPLEVFGEAVITTFYPALSRYYARNSVRPMMAIHFRGVRVLLLLLLPMTVVLALFAKVFVDLLFGHGAFSQADVELTAMTVVAMSLGLIFRALTYFNFRIFHAMAKPWLAVRIGFVGVALNAFLNYLLIGPLGLPGIALASSLAMLLCCLLSAVQINKTLHCGLQQAIFGRTGYLLKALGVSLFLSYVPLYFVLQYLSVSILPMLLLIFLCSFLLLYLLKVFAVKELLWLQEAVLNRLSKNYDKDLGA